MSNLLFICALEQEQNALLDQLGQGYKIITVSEKLSLQCYHYSYAQHSVFVCLSGMGNVNAGTKLALILEHTTIDQIVLLGVGGALHCDLNIGDMVVSNQVIQHDYCSSLDQGRFLMKPGELILDEHSASNYDPVLTSLPSSLTLDHLNGQTIAIYHSIIASGSEFVGSATRKQQLHKQCQGALLVDMEASAIACISQQYNTPFIIAKTVSDKLHSDGNISNDFVKFLDSASKNAAIVAQHIIALYLKG